VTWKRFIYWLYVGLVLYVEYGFWHSTLRGSKAPWSSWALWLRVALFLLRLAAYVLGFLLLRNVVDRLLV
jgi:hypothetical protein